MAILIFQFTNNEYLRPDPGLAYSYGKSTIQQPFPLNNEYTLVLTVGKCCLSDGKIIKKSGIKPDQDIDGKEQQLSKALKLLENINAYNEVFKKPEN